MSYDQIPPERRAFVISEMKGFLDAEGYGPVFYEDRQRFVYADRGLAVMIEKKIDPRYVGWLEIEIKADSDLIKKAVTMRFDEIVDEARRALPK